MAVLRDLRYGPADRNVLDLFIPVNDSQRDKPVLLFVHGGGFFSGDKQWSENVRIIRLSPWTNSTDRLQCWANIGNFFAQKGVIVAVASHQLVPFDRNGGEEVTKPSSVVYPAGADDIQLAREWIYQNIATEKFGNGSVDKVVLFGHSSGGAHIAMNLYASGDPDRASSKDVFPPIAGVIYLSVPFWYDRTRPIRKKILQSYYGSDAEDAWGVGPSEPTARGSMLKLFHQPRSALGLFQRLSDDSPLL